MTECGVCDGSGFSRDSILLRQEPCGTCHGRGEVENNEAAPMVVPPRLAFHEYYPTGD